jgi:hydrogenase/urease accessory protein HupE
MNQLRVPVLSACVFSAFCFFGSSSVSAHEVRPAYLELRETGEGTYDALWKVPAIGEDRRLSLYVEFPSGTIEVTTPRISIANDASIERWSVQRAGGLTGGKIHIAGLVATMTDVLVRMEHLNGATQVVRLTPASPTFIVAAAPSALDVARTYLVLGVEHILFGIDHLLFVLALLILVEGWRKLVKTITAFTVAHSITLGAATLGVVNVPSKPVEATIALSIVFVAAEIVRRRRTAPPSDVSAAGAVAVARGRETLGSSGAPSFTARWPWIVAFTFGLLHGFGFAGALSEVGLPQNAVPLALLFFNVGVELGQLLFIGAAMVGFAVMVRAAKKLGRPSVAPQSAFRRFENVVAYGIGGVAAFWLIERTLGFVA